jgi:hypothetical protein
MCVCDKERGPITVPEYTVCPTIRFVGQSAVDTNNHDAVAGLHAVKFHISQEICKSAEELHA